MNLEAILLVRHSLWSQKGVQVPHLDNTSFFFSVFWGILLGAQALRIDARPEAGRPAGRPHHDAAWGGAGRPRAAHGGLGMNFGWGPFGGHRLGGDSCPPRVLY